MRIAIAGILNKQIKKNSTGGTEIFTHLLAKELERRGHKITIFATSDSQVNGKLHSVCSSKDTIGVVEGGIETRIPYHIIQSQEIIKRSSSFDIIHNNYFDTFLFTPFSAWSKCPILTTVHNDFFQFTHLRKILLKAHRKNYDAFAFVSKQSKKLAAHPINSHVILNGIDTKTYTFKEKTAKNYSLWISRMVPKKGAKEAVQSAIKANATLFLSKYKSSNPEYQKYIKTHVAPFLSKKIREVDASSLSKKIKLYQNAKVFLFPMQWEEPFGLVMPEAMACGTPVVALARGATPEIIKDGVTGFLVNPSKNDKRGNWIIKKTGVLGLAEALKIIYSMPEREYLNMRLECRKHVEKKFSLTRLTNDYENIYKKLIRNSSN